MPTTLSTQMRSNAIDGEFDRADLLAAAQSMLDGRGITATEKNTFKTTFRALDANEDIYVANDTREAYGVLMRRLNPYSSKRQVFAPNLTQGMLTDIISLRTQSYTTARAKYCPANRADLEDPRLPIFALNRVGEPRYEKHAYRGPLFVNGVPAATDAVQGFISDCYFSGAAAAVAHARPELLAKNFEEHQDGTVTISFCDASAPDGKSRETVDRDLYYDQEYEALVFGSGGGAKSRGRMRMWYPLLEKAYAQRQGSYDALNQGGYEVEAIGCLIEGTGRTACLSDLSDEELVTELSQATEKHWPMTAGSLSSKHGRRYSKTGLSADHSYAFLGLTCRDGTTRVKLYNPWGNGEPTGNGKDDGVFELTLERFRHYYHQISWVECDEAAET